MRPGYGEQHSSSKTNVRHLTVRSFGVEMSLKRIPEIHDLARNIISFTDRARRLDPVVLDALQEGCSLLGLTRVTTLHELLARTSCSLGRESVNTDCYSRDPGLATEDLQSLPQRHSIFGEDPHGLETHIEDGSIEQIDVEPYCVAPHIPRHRACGQVLPRGTSQSQCGGTLANFAVPQPWFAGCASNNARSETSGLGEVHLYNTSSMLQCRPPSHMATQACGSNGLLDHYRMFGFKPNEEMDITFLS